MFLRRIDTAHTEVCDWGQCVLLRCRPGCQGALHRPVDAACRPMLVWTAEPDVAGAADTASRRTPTGLNHLRKITNTGETTDVRHSDDTLSVTYMTDRGSGMRDGWRSELECRVAHNQSNINDKGNKS